MNEREEKYRKYCDERMAQQIRDNSQELRELESRIRAAYVTKSLRLQLAEREKAKLEEKIRLENEKQVIREQQASEHEKELQMKRELRQKQISQRLELQQQITDKLLEQKILYEEFLKEKILIDEIMEQIRREQIEEIQEKMRMTNCLREDIDRLIQEQEAWKVQQKRIEAEENEKIVELIAEQEKRVEQAKENSRMKLAERIELQEKMCTELDAIKRQKIEREKLLTELKCKEVQEKQVLLDRKQLEQSIRLRLKTRLDLENQMHELEMRRLQKVDEEEQFRLEQLQILADQDRLETLTKERQRVKRMEHHRLVREMLAEREAARNAQVFDLIQEHTELLALEKRRQEIFERERLKILENHADDILGFLPRNLLKSAPQD